jgi:hypothetical protein
VAQEGLGDKCPQLVYVKKGHASDMKTTFVFNAKLISKKNS